MKTSAYLYMILITGSLVSQTLFLEQPRPVTSSLNCVVSTYYYSGSIAAWACGDSGVVLKTTSYGSSWINVPVGQNINLGTITYSFNNVAVALTAGIKNDTAVLFRTSDAGAGWNVVFRQYMGNILGIYASTAECLMVGNPVGGRWSVWKSSDAGITWDSAGLYFPQTANETGFINSFQRTTVQSVNYYLFGTNNNKIYYSTTMGSSWLTMQVPAQKNIYSVNFTSYYNSILNGYAGGDNKVLWTGNGGMNWDSMKINMGSGFIKGILVCPYPVVSFGGSQIMIIREDGNIYWPYFNYNWKIAYNAPAGNYRSIIQYTLYGSNSVYAVRDNGGISWGSCGTGGVMRYSSVLPDKFLLNQNYPNPFNPSSKITFDVPVNSHVRLSVFDVLGREVSRLVDLNLTPGQYETEWDAGNMPSGVYFYSLIAGDYSYTKKMILVK